MNEITLYTTYLYQRLEAASCKLRRGESERGSVTMEQAIITAGLAILAGVVIAAVVAAVNTYLAKIH